MSYAIGIGSLQQAVHSPSPSETRASSASAPESDQFVSSVERADQSSLSSVGGLVAQALGSSDTRAAKVAALQQAIADGSYNVSSSDVAEKIVQSLLD